jgi:hypothetical protein
VTSCTSSTRCSRYHQCRSSKRVRGGFTPERPTIQYTSEYPLCWLHFNANTFVSDLPDSPPFSLLIDPSKQYVFEPYWTAFHISPLLHDALGCYIVYDGSAPDFLFACPFSNIRSQAPPITLLEPSSLDSSLALWRLPFSPVLSSFYQNGTSAPNLGSALHCWHAAISSAMPLARSWPQAS